MSEKDADDIGFDVDGTPLEMSSADVRNKVIQMVNDPNSDLVMVILMLGGELAVQVFGPPSAETADLLDHVAMSYRESFRRAQAQRAFHRMKNGTEN